MAKPGYKAGSPTPEIVGALSYSADGTGTGTGWGLSGVRVPIAASVGTVSWTNTQPFPVAAQAFVYFSTAGTGTFDMGVGTAGTSANDIIDGGTMDNSDGTFLARPDAGSSTVGAQIPWYFIGGSGSSTCSIVLVHSETNTSTAVGAIYIQLAPLQ